MTNVVKPSKFLGIAFLFQFVTSILSGAVINGQWFVEGDIAQTMQNIATNPLLFRFNIMLDILTAMGIVFLGVMLFIELQKHGKIIALTSLGLYVIEASLLAVSRISSYALLKLSESAANSSQPYLSTLGSIAYDSADFVGSTLHVLVFCIGALGFYYLLFKGRTVPRLFSLWAIITLFPMLFGTIMHMFDIKLPFYIYAPYVPFEFVIGIWIIITGSFRNAKREDAT